MSAGTIQGSQVKAKLFRGFSEPSRLAIIEALRQGSLTVNEIVEITGLTQPNVSNHLGCLRSCGLVTNHSSGRFIRYQLKSTHINEMLGLADRILAEVSTTIEGCPNDPDNPPPYNEQRG